MSNEGCRTISDFNNDVLVCRMVTAPGHEEDIIDKGTHFYERLTIYTYIYEFSSSTRDLAACLVNVGGELLANTARRGGRSGRPGKRHRHR